MMGWTWEVKVWKAIDGEVYGYHSYWHGKSLVVAIWHMNKARRYGWGCIALEWRPQ